LVGKYALGLYLGSGAAGSAYGAAGSLITMLIWIYHAAQIVLFGAEFTRVYAQERGRGIRPAKGPEPVQRQPSWRHFGLQPHRLRRYMVSDDPEFEEKAADIIGLYLKPPLNAAVFCVDEKSAIQALDRLDPVLPLSPGRAERHGVGPEKTISPDPVNTTSGLQLSEFGSLEPGSQGHLPPWLRRHLLPQSSNPWTRPMRIIRVALIATTLLLSRDNRSD
jgi:virulence factor BrkB